jgi:hypothetical protein
MRWLPRLAVLTLGVSAALTVAAPSSAGTALDMTAVPADFASVMGYEPATGRLADGSTLLINPAGSCSVPGSGRPFDFEVACQAHDYGYDLLRYAGKKGIAVSPAVRTDLDERLAHNLHTQCEADNGLPATCDATVAVFQAAVTFNSWRQLSGPPVDQSGLTRTAGLILLALIGSAAAVRLRRAAAFRLRRAAAPRLHLRRAGRPALKPPG